MGKKVKQRGFRLFLLIVVLIALVMLGINPSPMMRNAVIILLLAFFIYFYKMPFKDLFGSNLKKKRLAKKTYGSIEFYHLKKNWHIIIGMLVVFLAPIPFFLQGKGVTFIFLIYGVLMLFLGMFNAFMTYNEHSFIMDSSWYKRFEARNDKQGGRNLFYLRSLISIIFGCIFIYLHYMKYS